jgi:hypothetical protein
MVRWVPAVLLALILSVLAIPASADNDDEIVALTDKIEAGKFAGLALAQAYMELGTRKLIGKDTPGALAAPMTRPSRRRPSTAKPMSGGRSAASSRVRWRRRSTICRRR